MQLQCPNCSGSHVEKVQLAYASSRSGYYRTNLGDSLAPPRQMHWLAAGFLAYLTSATIVGLLALITALILTPGAMAGQPLHWMNLTDTILISVAGAVFIAGLIYSFQALRKPKTHRQNLQLWQRQWFCRQCGHRWVPPTESASDVAATRTSQSSLDPQTIDILQKIDQLRQTGGLTEEEYGILKRSLLDRGT